MNLQQKNPMGESDATMAPVSGKNGRREVVVAILLVMCVAIVGFWEFMAGRSRNGFDRFQLTGDDFADFIPILDRWSVKALVVQNDPIEPNILAYQLDHGNSRLTKMGCPLLVRLVHGYNMCDCMRIKGYEVDLLKDTRRIDAGESNHDSSIGGKATPQLQTWKVTSSSGDVSVWVTSMIRAYDMSETSLDTRLMAFPRVNVPDAQGWFPRGFTWSSLRHPMRNMKRFMRAKWNASRCDWLTFLGLRRPAWASEDVLTLVASSCGTSFSDELIDDVVVSVSEAHQAMYRELLEWQARRSASEDN